MRTNVSNLVFFLLVAFITNSSSASWPYTTGDNIFSSPAIADLNGDGKLEIVFGSWDGYLYCLDPMGNLKWNYNFSGSQISSSPTIADLDNDTTTREVVIGAGVGWISGVIAVLKHDGTLLASFNTTVSFPASPLITDLENDGEKEIIMGEQEGQGSYIEKLYCVRVVKNGSNISLVQKWDVARNGAFYSSAVAADFDGDGQKEVIVGCGNKLYCFETDGTDKWQQTVGSYLSVESPCIADLNENNQPDVLIGSYNGTLYYVNGLNGQIIWTFLSGSESILGSVALANIIEDYHPEVIIPCHSFAGINALVCINHLGVEKWRAIVPEYIAYSSPAVGDLTGDGSYEILIGTDDLGSNPANMRCYNANGVLVWAATFPSLIYSSPALADMDNDGNLEIAFGCYNYKFYVLNHLGNVYQPANVVTVTDKYPWPMFRQNNNRTGLYVRPDPIAVNDPGSEIPLNYSLAQNFPNPFNPSTKISFSLTRTGLVTLKIFDAMGREIKTLINEVKYPGSFTVNFDGTEYPSGIYYCRMESGNFKQVMKMILLK